MLMIEEMDTKSAAWDDPLVPAHLKMLAKLTRLIQELHGGEWRKKDIAKCSQLAGDVCEATREVVFRLHRVTRKRVEEIVAGIQDAERALAMLRDEMANAGQEFAAEASRVGDYSKHVDERAKLLKRLLA